MTVACAPSRSDPRQLWRAALAGMSASLVGIGLARFAYTPLLPAIVDAHWFGADQAAYFGAANLAGYLVGVVVAGALASRIGARASLRGAMLAAGVALLACAWPFSGAWFFVWRVVSGIGGGVVMVLAAPTVLGQVPPSRRGLAGGFVFMGVGLGIAASGTLVPLLVQQGLRPAWLTLATISLSLTTAAWNAWPADAVPASVATSRAAPALHPTLPLRALYFGYALNAAGLVPHMIFLVAYVAHGLGQGIAAGSAYWVAFGIGAVIGPPAAGYLADRIGPGKALRAAYALQVAAIAIPALGISSPGPLLLSSVLIGACTPGVVPLALGRVRELLVHHPALHQRAWSRATTGFAAMQAVGAYGMSFLLGPGGFGYRAIFALGACAVGLALIVDLVVARRVRAAP